MGAMPPRGGVLGLAASALITTPAAAQAEVAQFRIPEQPRVSALLALARQAGLSLGFTPDARCGGRAGLVGRMNVDEALARLLAGSGCLARRPDARTIVIRGAPSRPPPAAPLSPPAPAAEPDTRLSEIVVTADKSEQLLSQAAAGLTVADGGDLQAVGVAEVGDLSLLAAGVTVTNLGPGRDKVILRGLSDGPLTGHTQSTVGLYLGDLRLTYNAPDPDLPLIDMARVEVLRGPQGSLYGAGSIGGVLQFVPNAPDLAQRGGSLAASVSATAHGGLSNGLDGVLNQPFAGGAAGARLAVWSERTAGVIDDVLRGARDVDRTRRQGLRLGLLWRAAPDLDLGATLIEQNIDTRDAHYADPAAGPLAHASALPEPHDNDFLALVLGARWSPVWGRASLSLGALDHDVNTTYDAAAAPPELAPAGTRPRSYVDGNEIRAVVLEGRLSSVGTSRWQWKAGVFASAGEQHLNARIQTTDGATGYAEARRDRLREASIFGELTYDLTRRITFTAGGRLFQSRLATRSRVTLADAARPYAGRTKDAGLAPKLVAAFRPRPGLTLYIQAAEGYRTPGLNTSGPLDQPFSEEGGAQPLRRYAPDELWSYEAGVRWRAPALGLNLRLAAFQADWTSIQADTLLPSGLPFTANLGDGRSQGVEAEAAWTIGGLEFGGNFVRQEPELRRPAPGLPFRADTGLPGVPDLSYAAYAAYERTMASDRSLRLQASYDYVGRSRLAFDALTAPSMGGYGDLRVAATLGWSRMSLRLSVDNLLDRRGDTLAFGDPFLLRTRPLTTPQRPRTLAASLNRAF